PYPEGYEEEAMADLDAQSNEIVKTLAESGIEVKKDREIIALIAYLQRLGTDIQVKD
ncbi:MAG: cbb3-type cytochrome c oxidase subunit II, partial [Bacteroidota bacterium]